MQASAYTMSRSNTGDRISLDLAVFGLAGLGADHEIAAVHTPARVGACSPPEPDRGLNDYITQDFRQRPLVTEEACDHCL